jgi:hypothetical protein
MDLASQNRRKRGETMNVRLKTNVIISGKNYPRDSIVDVTLLPEHLRTEEYVAGLEDTDGKVLLLRDLHYQSLPRPSASGIATSFPVHRAMGELIDLAIVPASRRESLKEGEDYNTDWTYEEQEQLKLAQADIYKESESFQPPSGLMRRNR